MSTDIALPFDLQAELAKFAKDAAAKERPQVSRISFKSGVMSYQGAPIPGNKMEVIIVASAHRHTLYKQPYDPDTPVSPDCFALSEEGDGIAPHENVTNPEHTSCDGCPMNEWGSIRLLNPKSKSKGKACKQGRRLVVMPANQATSADEVTKAEIALVDLPVTSVKNFATLVNVVAASRQRPVWAVVTVMQAQPHVTNQFEVTFTPVRLIEDEEALRAIMARREEALRIALTPFEGTGGEADPAVGAPVAMPANGKKKY